MLPVLTRKLENINLHNCVRYILPPRISLVLTASDSNVLGTATRRPSWVVCAVGGQHAKEQKFKAFTSSMYKIHGWDRSGADSSSGRAVLMVVSS